MLTFTMILQLCIVLGALWVGSRYGSLALGAISGIGLAILVFFFQMKLLVLKQKEHPHI